MHTRAYVQRDILLWMAVNFFKTFFLFKSFFSYSHYKRKEQDPAELKKELTNTMKTLQFAKICSALSNVYDWGGVQVGEGTGGAEWEGLESKGPASSME